MITISHEEDYVHIIVTGEFTLQDYQEFEENALYQFTFHGATNMLFDLSQMLHYTIDVAAEEVRFFRAHRQNFGRVAIVSCDQMVNWATWLNNLISEAEVRHFDEVEDARAWLAGAPNIAPTMLDAQGS